MKARAGAAALIGLVTFAFCAHAEEPRFYTHTVEARDTLMKLGDRYLIKRSNWQIIEQANVIKNPRALPLGSRLKIPVAAMRADSVQADVIATQGGVTSSAGVVARGTKIGEGDEISTGDAGFVTIKLADGSMLTVQPKSVVRLETTRQLVNSGGVTDTIVRLDSGRVETVVSKQKNSGARYEIRTPTSNMGVRGTIFRVGADATGKRGQGEVVDGLVDVIATPARAWSNLAALALGAGFGTVVEAGKPPSPPIALLKAPDITMLPGEFQKPDVNFVFTALPAAVAYRAQVARDSSFATMVADASSNIPDMKFVDLPDGALFVRVRGIDVNGLEGQDATHAFTMRARPLPPLLSAPSPGSRQSSGNVTFAWQAAIDAVAYRVQVAEDEKFVKTTVDQQAASAVTLLPATALAPAAYFWRVASVNAKGETGPWSDTRSFNVAVDAPQLKVVWANAKATLEIVGSTATSYQVQIARDERFQTIASDTSITGNTLELGALPSNAYYIRVRAAAGTWSEPRLLEVYPFGNWWLSTSLTPKSASIRAGK